MIRWPTKLTRIDVREQSGQYILSWASWDETETGRIIETFNRSRYDQVVLLVLALRRGDQPALIIPPEPIGPKYATRLNRKLEKKTVQREDRRRAYLKATGRL